jgi:hypothetical protein
MAMKNSAMTVIQVLCRAFMFPFAVCLSVTLFPLWMVSILPLHMLFDLAADGKTDPARIIGDLFEGSSDMLRSLFNPLNR